MEYFSIPVIALTVLLWWQSGKIRDHIRRLERLIKDAEDLIAEFHAVEDRAIRRGGRVGGGEFSFTDQDVRDAMTRIFGEVQNVQDNE